MITTNTTVPSTSVLRARSMYTTPSPNPTSRTLTSHDKGSCGGTSSIRWMLLGIMVGSTATGILQSLHLPSVCINLHVGDNENVHPLEQMQHDRLKAKKQKKRQKKQIMINYTVPTGATAGEASGGSQTTHDQAGNEASPDGSPFFNLPPPPTLLHNESFSACLLIKDDNHWLIEWLAYHYFVLPLRNLIVVIDPESKTSPRNILDRWSSRGLMDIRIWKDEDFMPAKVTARPEMFDGNTQLMMHRVRQNNFLRRCIPTFRNRKREWVVLVDTDEYILPSYASGHFRNLTSKISFLEGGSVLRLLKYHEQVVKDHNNTCVYMPRFFYGARESRMQLIKYAVPAPISAENMLTQKYLFREPRQNYNGKNLINTYRVPELKTFGGVHHVATACPDPKVVRGQNQNKHALIRVHHYLGTQEQYLFRDDPRLHANNEGNRTKFGSFNARGLQRYNEYNRKANHEDHAAKAWIRGFVNEMGVELASNLLEGVGQVGYE